MARLFCESLSEFHMGCGRIRAGSGPSHLLLSAMWVHWPVLCEDCRGDDDVCC